MNGAIFVIHENPRRVTELRQQDYESEHLLQQLLADHPSVLAGDQIDSANPRQWLLITREMGVPASEGTADRWSLDHLFVDQDAVPTLVEVKRRKDTRLRREVVGQLLDYAANGVAYWPADSLRTHFEERCAREGKEASEVLAQHIGEHADQEQFWTKVKTNLQAGKLRLVFVADRIPSELQRIVEFLNRQMDPAEVLAVEIKQYVGEGLKTLVPRVIGKLPPPARPPARQWDEDSFFAELERQHGGEAAKVARDLLQWARKCHLQIQWDTGRQFGHFYVLMHVGGVPQTLVRVYAFTG